MIYFFQYTYEVTPTIEEVLRADRLEARHKSFLESALRSYKRNNAEMN